MNSMLSQMVKRPSSCPDKSSDKAHLHTAGLQFDGRRLERASTKAAHSAKYIAIWLQAGDDGMKQVEDEALMGLKGAAGMDTSREAMHQVLGHERDLILARCTHTHMRPAS